METRPKVLIVDDEESLRFFYSEEMRTEGYDPIQAKKGKENYRENFMSWPAGAYVTKSSDSGELEETMRNLLEREEKKG
jgi:CheY-like chemotaxis protein